MERRTLLVAGAGSAALAACGTTPRLDGLGAVDGVDLGAALADIDRARAAVAHWKMPTLASFGVGRPAVVASAADATREDHLRKGLSAMVLASAVHDLPVRARQHPEVLGRLWSAAPDADLAILGTYKELAKLSADDVRCVQARLREKPGLALEIASTLSDGAKDIETPWTGRARLRNVAVQVGWMLERQPFDVVLAKLQDKIRRASLSRAMLAPVQRELRTRLGEDAFWRHHEQLLALAPTVRMASDPDYDKFYGDKRFRESPREDEGPSTALTVGFVLLGLAALCALIAAVSNDFGTAAGMGTLGALLLLSALIAFIVAAAE